MSSREEEQHMPSTKTDAPSSSSSSSAKMDTGSSLPSKADQASAEPSSSVTLKYPPVEGETVIRTLENTGDKITLFSAPFNLAGLFEIGVRMAAIQTSKGVVIWNPIFPEQAVKTRLSQLEFTTRQPVTFIIAPNLVHHVFLDQMAAVYPEAMIVAPKGLLAKHPHLASRFFEIDKPQADNVPNFPAKLELAMFPDFKYSDIVMLHRESKTCFISDLVFNLPAREAYSQVANPDRKPEQGMQQLAANKSIQLYQWLTSSKTEAFKEQAQRVMDWAPRIVVVQHGEVITGDHCVQFIKDGMTMHAL